MSRSHLLTAARMLRLSTEYRRDGKRCTRDNMRLRSDILTRCYGPGLTCNYKSPADADTACLTAARTATGELGEPLREAQDALREAMRALNQYRNAVHTGDLDRAEKALRMARRYLDTSRNQQEDHIGA